MPIRFRWSGSNVHPHYMTGGKGLVGGPTPDPRPLHNHPNHQPGPGETWDSREYLERECRRARDTPSYENIFKRLHLTLPTRQDVRWLGMEAWDACGKKVINKSDLNGRTCFAGLDLSTTTDLSPLVLEPIPKPL